MASAPDPAPIQRMEELLTCCVCKETLNEPTMLPCFHSFCKKCLARYVEIQRDDAQRQGRAEHLFKCPTCRTQFQLGQHESVEGLPSNQIINNLLDILKIQQEAQKLPCESCNGQLPAECRCVQCESYLCKNCLNMHNNCKAFKSHDVLTLAELAKPENQAKAKAKPRCHKHGHENKHLEYYCKTCQQLACITCVVLDHPKPEHDSQTISAVAEQQKQELETTSAMLQEKSVEGQNALQKIKRASQNLQDNKKKSEEAILQQEKHIMEEFNKKLKRNTAALIDEVDRKHNEINQKLVKQQDDIKAYVEKVNGSLKYAKSIIEKGSNEEIITLGIEIKSNANNIEKECPRSMRPVHYGFLEYQQEKSTKNIVDNLDLTDLGTIITIGKFIIWTNFNPVCKHPCQQTSGEGGEFSVTSAIYILSSRDHACNVFTANE